MNRVSSAWSGFWRDEPSATSGATLAQLPEALRESLDAPWRDLARSLPTRAKILDLATGGGVVLEILRRERRDLNLTGVDTASNLPKRSGMTLKSGVSVERIPFPDGRFDAVTSRFGIEYVNLERGASEATRILKVGGRICFIVHHAKSNIVRHNRARREALCWAARESGWTEIALATVRARRVLRIPTPSALGDAQTDSIARFPDQSVAHEFLTGLKQLLDSGATEAQIIALQLRADEELSRLASLLTAACDEDKLLQLTNALTQGGVSLHPARPISEPDGIPLAWCVEGRKA